MKTIFDTAKRVFTYEAFKAFVKDLFEQGKVTGDEQTGQLLDSAGMGLHRMHRIDRNIKITKKLEHTLGTVDNRWIWYLISEGWCGDSSQSVPVIAKIADSSPNITLKILLRDENPKIMDAYLTNGGRSIPKLICVNAETGKELGTWGPRTDNIKEMFTAFKQANPELDKEELAKNLHLWYGRDRGNSLQEEFNALINKWNN